MKELCKIYILLRSLEPCVHLVIFYIKGIRECLIYLVKCIWLTTIKKNDFVMKIRFMGKFYLNIEFSGIGEGLLSSVPSAKF